MKFADYKKDVQTLIFDLIDLKQRALKLNLGKTTQAIDKATQAIGWELGDKIEQHQKKAEEM
jgi:hypothetical protein